MKSTQQLPKYRIEYFFNHSKFGFSNSITVEAINQKEAKALPIPELGQKSNWLKDVFQSRLLW